MLNKKGIAGTSFLIGILVAVICIVISMALTPVMVSSFGMARGSDAANCPGYIDPQVSALGANNHSYNPARNTDTLTCTVTDFGTGMIVLSIVFGIIAGILSGNFGKEEQPQQSYAGYGYQ